MTNEKSEDIIKKMANIAIKISSLRHGIENAAWEEARGKLMAYLRLRGSSFGGDQEEYDALKDEIENFINRIDEGDIYSPDPDEITRLREENARLRRLVKTAYSEGCYDTTKTEKTQDELEALWQESFAYKVILEGGKDDQK